MANKESGASPEVSGAGRIRDRYAGEFATVVHCEGALKSFHEALGRVQGKKSTTLTIQMILQIQRLADHGPRALSGNHFVPEAELPRVEGSRAGKFFALKRIPIRGYCWESRTHQGTWFISHYMYKDQQKLHSRDINRVHRNWHRYEEES